MSIPVDLFELLTPEFQMEKPWWKVAKAYFDSHTFTEHQLDSYNTFMREKLPNIITSSSLEYNKDKISYVVTFENVYVNRPEFTEPSGVTRKLIPQDCRIRNLTYTCRVYTDVIRYTLDNEGKISESTTFPEVFIGAMPTMVLSEYCNLYGKDSHGMIKNGECSRDPGGYFIINGSEKVLMSQDRMAYNEIFVFKSKSKDTIKLQVPGTDRNRSIPSAWHAEVRSYSREIEPNISTTYMRFSTKQLDKGEDSRLYMELPGLKSPVPWPIIFMALGITDTDEMISYVCPEDDIPLITLLLPSLDCPSIKTQSQALKYLSDFVLTTQKDQRMIQLKRILREKLFQNITNVHMKRFYLGHMTYQLLATALGRRKQDDRDHYGKKRVETAGALINNLFKSIWKRVLRETKNNLEKKRTNDLAQLLYSKFTGYIKPPFATGNWTAIKASNKPAKSGISQILNRHNYVSTLSNLRRVITPSDKNSKIVKPRHLHNSQWTVICPAETPEGAPTGLIKNLSLLTSISLESSPDQIIDWLELTEEVQLVDSLELNPGDIQSQTKIFVNGGWIALTLSADHVVAHLRDLRREGKIDHQVSISLSKEGIRIFTDEGRVLSPFLITTGGKLPELPASFNWRELIETGIIELLDPLELETLYHSVYPWKLEPDHTHSVIHPCFILGVSASTIPYPDHNQSPRNVYQSAMGKQALGIFSGNFLQRYDTSAHILCYPQKPLVNTKPMQLLGTDNLPTGQNLIVAVMSAAYNQEDSVIINQRSLDNGSLRSIAYTTYSESNHRKGNVTDEIKRPEKSSVKETRLQGYDKLDVDGVSKEDTPLAKRDVVVGKVRTESSSARDTSVIVKTNGMEDNAVVEKEWTVDMGKHDRKVYSVYDGSAVVDRAILTLNEDSFRTVKVRVRQMRIPQIGDKVASRSAQKGIIGMILPPEDMPFSAKTGMTPDLIMNPNAIPSRMTVAQPLEAFIGKACALRGSYADCTPFEPEFKDSDGNFPIKVVSAELTKHGYLEYGDEIMLNGMTGEEIPCKIFMGPTYYQRLKHMVDDKIHSRDQNGPRETLTRQPVEGRKRGGGFRMGEMETWCGVSHGASKFLIDRLVNNSDGYEMFVCDYCGNIAIATLKTNRYECKRCQQNIAISKVRIPYAFKLLMQELQATGMGIWLTVDTTKTLIPATTPSH